MQPWSSNPILSGDGPGRAEFREHGSPRRHDAHELCIGADSVEFETDYAVAPGSRLSLMAAPDTGDPEIGEVGVIVLRVDSRPGDRFRVAGRLQRAR